LYRNLPLEVQRAARRSFLLWSRNPRNPSVQFKKVGGVWSARVGNTGFRALAVVRGDTAYWFWIGPHDEYERILASF